MSRRTKFVQDLVGLALVVCTLPPLVEMLLHSGNSIFAGGHDIPSTLVFVLLLVELSFSIAHVLTVFRPAVLQRVGVVPSYRLTARSESAAGMLPTVSPPVPLRI